MRRNIQSEILGYEARMSARGGMKSGTDTEEEGEGRRCKNWGPREFRGGIMMYGERLGGRLGVSSEQKRRARGGLDPGYGSETAPWLD